MKHHIFDALFLILYVVIIIGNVTEVFHPASILIVGVPLVMELFKRFTDWVDSHFSDDGPGSDDHLKYG